MDIQIRKGTAADMEGYIAFLHGIQETMAQPDWFFIDPDEKTRALMAAGRMELWLAEAGERTAGVFAIIHPGLDAFNLGCDLGLEEEELLRVVHMDTAAVHPDFRGMKLQARLVARAEEELARRGRQILLCTVHPENRYSVQNVLKPGYSIEKKLGKYGSVRYLLRKNIG